MNSTHHSRSQAGLDFEALILIFESLINLVIFLSKCMTLAVLLGFLIFLRLNKIYNTDTHEI